MDETASEKNTLEDIRVPDYSTVEQHQVDLVSEGILNGVKDTLMKWEKRRLNNDEEARDEILEYIKSEIVEPEVEIDDKSEASILVSDRRVMLDNEVVVKVEDRIKDCI